MTVVCPVCGSKFGCMPEGDCWCKTAECKLPVPEKAFAACLCSVCLAKQLERNSATPAIDLTLIGKR